LPHRGGGRRAGGFAAALVGLSVLLAACSSPPATSSTPTTTAPVAAAPVWLCRPGLVNDPCTTDLTTTVAPGPSPTSSTTVQTGSSSATAAPLPIDCFYVYPTVSTQTTTNANLNIDPAETDVAKAQVASFAPDCRIFAPIYRQYTVSALLRPSGLGSVRAAAEDVAYAGVLAAWNYYLAHDNHGRGVVFIGHSQGASMLIRLLSSEVDPNPAERRLLVSAILLGGNVEVPVGKTVGGSFQNIPACNSTAATGCVVAYSTFDKTPPAASLFGRPGQGVSLLSGQPPGPSSSYQVLCVNPASLSSPTTPGPLDPRFPTPAGAVSAGSDPNGAKRSTSPWVTYPNLYTAQCENQDGASWLQINDVAPPGDTRPVVNTSVLGPTWGLHLEDVNLALGNLVALVQNQGIAFAAQSIGGLGSPPAAS
jgi:hypothetical protein